MERSEIRDSPGQPVGTMLNAGAHYGTEAGSRIMGRKIGPPSGLWALSCGGQLQEVPFVKAGDMQLLEAFTRRGHGTLEVDAAASVFNDRSGEARAGG